MRLEHILKESWDFRFYRWRIYTKIPSMGRFVYLPTWMVDVYGKCIGKYTIITWILWVQTFEFIFIHIYIYMYIYYHIPAPSKGVANGSVTGCQFTIPQGLIGTPTGRCWYIYIYIYIHIYCKPLMHYIFAKHGRNLPFLGGKFGHPSVSRFFVIFQVIFLWFFCDANGELMSNWFSSDFFPV